MRTKTFFIKNKPMDNVYNIYNVISRCYVIRRPVIYMIT